MHSLESKRRKLELDAPLNWQPEEFMECVIRYDTIRYDTIQ